MAKRTMTETFQSSTTNSTSKAHSQSQSQSQSQSTTKKLLDSELLNQILGGLAGNMTDKEIAAFAENLLRPQLNAGIEASRQNFETTKLSKEQEIANLAANLTLSLIHIWQSTDTPNTSTTTRGNRAYSGTSSEGGAA